MHHDLDLHQASEQDCTGHMSKSNKGYDESEGWSECNVSDMKKYLSNNNCLEPLSKGIKSFFIPVYSKLVQIFY